MPNDPTRLWLADISYASTWEGWLYVAFITDCYTRRICGYQMPPRDGVWGERYFHLTDPDGHELSFARPLPRGGPGSG